MKRKRTAVIYLLALVATLPLNASELQEDRIRVDFSDPSRFLDIDLEGADAERGRKIVLEKVREVFVDEAQKYLPSGFNLKIQVRDIDLAGGFERWPPGQDHVRIDRDIYPPRIEFEYEILDESGRLVTLGEEYIYNLTYLTDPDGEERRSKEVAYEVSMLIRNWTKDTLARKVSELVS